MSINCTFKIWNQEYAYFELYVRSVIQKQSEKFIEFYQIQLILN